MTEVIERLAALLEDEAFHATPLLEPDDRYFPDRWDATPNGARCVLARLAAYAGVPRNVEVVSSPFEGAGAVLAEVRQDAVVFEVPRALDARTGDLFTCLSAREVVRARRLATGVYSEHDDEEEIAIDLEGLALGFGILTANGASMFRAQDLGIEGQMARSKWQQTSAVALSADDLTLGLAAFVCGQGRAPRELARIARALEANQRAVFEAACRDPKTPAALGMRAPVDADVEARRKAADRWLLAADRAVERARHVAESEPEEAGEQRVERIGFRVKPGIKEAAFSTPSWFAGLTTAAATVVATQSWILAGVGALAAAGVGALFNRLRRPVCAQCERSVERDAAGCASCGVTFVGDIAHRNHRLAAEERHLEAQRRKQPGYRDRA